MARRTYQELDEALLPLHHYLQLLMPQDFSITEGGQETGIEMEHLALSMPIEIDVVPEADGTVSVGMSPPLYYVETGFAPVGHQVRITIVQDGSAG